jgi:hypothetical protein
MPLIDLKTDLKSLKYGKDQPGEGSSGQPYITTDIDGDHITKVNFPSNSVLGLFGLGLNSLPSLPNISTSLNRSKIGRLVNDLTSGDDFIRGGALGAAQASINDAFRIGSFFLSLPKGPIFIAKQVGLQLSNPLLEVKKGGRGLVNGALNLSPGSLLGTITGGMLGTNRIYNLGINTLAQVPVNAFGVHFSRHGLLPTRDNSNNYESVVTFNNESNRSQDNRLVGLVDKFDLGKATLFSQQSEFTSAINKVSGFLTGTFGLPNITKWKPINFLIKGPTLGGPSSVYGVGFTSIHRTQYTGDSFKNNAIYLSNEATLNLSQTNLNYYNTLGVSKQYFIGQKRDKEGGIIGGYNIDNKEITKYTNIDVDRATKRPQNNDRATYANVHGDYIQLKDNKAQNRGWLANGEGGFGELQEVAVSADKKPSKRSYSRYKALLDGKDSKKILSNGVIKDTDDTILNGVNIFDRNEDDEVFHSSPSYKTISDGGKIGYINGYQDIIKIAAPRGWFGLSREERVGSGRIDQINLTPIFSNTTGTIADNMTIGNKSYNINDLVKFRIQAVDGKDPSKSDYMIFRAYLTQLSDNVDATWSNVKYAGRGEDFYIYGGFGRKVQIGFKVASLSEGEMKPMYQKLNYLMGNLMPDYNGTLMRGPMMRMTVGNWLDGQFGILNSLSYTIPQDSPWEIALTGGGNLILPHVVEVSMTFTPIGSQTKKDNKLASKSTSTSHIAQNINDNQYITGNILQAEPTLMPVFENNTIDTTTSFNSDLA